MKQTQSAAKPSDLPVYLFHQGNNFEAYRYFGSHLEEQDGQPGAVFRVWAPHAKAVSVVGDFNSWVPTSHPMEKVSDGIWELFACYGLLLNYARQMGWDVERGSINLTNTAKPYPFNNSQKTVALQMQRPSRDYIVITEASNVKGNLGQIEVSDQLSNGFKVAYTGSATAATINYIVIGGYMK